MSLIYGLGGLIDSEESDRMCRCLPVLTDGFPLSKTSYIHQTRAIHSTKSGRHPAFLALPPLRS